MVAGLQGGEGMAAGTLSLRTAKREKDCHLRVSARGAIGPALRGGSVTAFLLSLCLLVRAMFLQACYIIFNSLIVKNAI